MTFTREQARTQSVTAEQRLKEVFRDRVSGGTDAMFYDAARKRVIGFTGMPYTMPVCRYLASVQPVCAFMEEGTGDLLFRIEDCAVTAEKAEGKVSAPKEVLEKALEVYCKLYNAKGELNENGELTLDLMTMPVGPHYPVNLLLGNRAGYPYPLITTPKSALDGLGRGSFRAAGFDQVLATRCVLEVSENGEPANRQFYLTENGKQIFYSANVHENVKSAVCVHSQNRSVITYETEDGLKIVRTIFILPQKEGMPAAVEAQRIEIENHSGKKRDLRIVLTGVFGFTDPGTVASDIVYANLVAESEMLYDDGKPAVLSLSSKPKIDIVKKRFALLFTEGETMDGFCTSQADFIGSGSLDHPDLVAHLPNQPSRKMTPFFAMEKSFTLEDGASRIIDSYAGMSQSLDENEPDYDSEITKFLSVYRNPDALAEVLAEIIAFWKKYPSYIVPKTEDPVFNAYVGHNLPFQTLYQTYVSRGFAWTQKSYREIGFREIQDIYASMYYLSNEGNTTLIKELISSWIENVFRMGYANHNFTFRGKEPGDCSDDQLWLTQAVYRYVKLTGDTGFLNEMYPIQGEKAERSLLDTLVALVTYSGRISVGKHHLPLLDKADWNDTLKLDKVVLQGPAKEAKYMQQLEEKHQEYGVPWENELTESTMNACLLKIAADELCELAQMVGREDAAQFAKSVSDDVYENMQKYAWKDTFFARCLINDVRPGGYTYLGAKGDGLALEEGFDGTYFLNSYSWPILAGIATEEQIRPMLDTVNQYLRTDAGLKLCTLVDFDRLNVETGTALYYPGDRENGGVFKHAAMMATVASLRAAKIVKDEALAKDLAELAFFMISRTLPYRTMQDPFVLKGNPRFCTQYNNSETGENIGPMLSGTASWLTLAVYEYFGIETDLSGVKFDPILNPAETSLSYILNFRDTEIEVSVKSEGGRFRMSPESTVTLDGKPFDGMVKRGLGGKHKVEIIL